jgi:hypothetical protein
MQHIGKIVLGAGGVLIAVFAAIMVIGTQLEGKKAAKEDERRKACANEIYWAAKYSKTPNDLDALVRSRPYAQKVCAGFDINGIAVIPQ